jgi:hypothetical protein
MKQRNTFCCKTVADIHEIFVRNIWYSEEFHVILPGYTGMHFEQPDNFIKHIYYREEVIVISDHTIGLYFNEARHGTSDGH